MGPKISTSGFASIKWIEWEQEAEEGSKSQPPWKGVCRCSTRECSALLQGAVNTDAATRVLRWWRRWVSKPLRRHWTGNNGQVGRYGVIQQLAGYAEHIQWLDELVTRNTMNVVVGTFEVIHKKIPGQGYNSELEDLLQKLKVVEAFCRQFSGVRKKGIP